MQIILLPASSTGSSTTSTATVFKQFQNVVPKPSSNSSGSEHDCESLADDGYELHPTRKRQRLEGLSEQEKLFRRYVNLHFCT